MTAISQQEGSVTAINQQEGYVTAISQQEGCVTAIGQYISPYNPPLVIIQIEYIEVHWPQVMAP